MQYQLNAICTADYFEAAVEWEEWTVEDSEFWHRGRQWHQFCL